jgi:hypothetical protein
VLTGTDAGSVGLTPQADSIAAKAVQDAMEATRDEVRMGISLLSITGAARRARLVHPLEARPVPSGPQSMPRMAVGGRS